MNLLAIPHLEQKSPEWFHVRLGRATASDAKFIITPKKAEPSASRLEYIDSLIAELYIPVPKPDDENYDRYFKSGQADEDLQLYTGKTFYGNRYTNHGVTHEPFAREDFERKMRIDLKEVGFITADDVEDGLFGLSPDGTSHDADKINATGKLDFGFETKCKCLKGHIKTVRENEVPTEHLGQIHFSLAKTGAQSWFYHSFFPGVKSHTIEVKPNDYTKRAEDALGQFMDEYKTERARLVPMLNIGNEAETVEVEEVA